VFGYALTPASALVLSLASLALVFEAGRRARWAAPLSDHLRWALATAFVLLGHRMTVRLGSGLELHYLGSAFLALLLGYPRALVSMGLVLAIECVWPAGGVGASAAGSDGLSAAGAAAGAALDLGGLSTWGLRVLLSAVLPVWSMWMIVMACKRWLPRNPFVFLLGCGLIGLFLSYALQLLGTAFAYAVLVPAIPRGFWEDFVPYALLLATGEAWLEGMLTTLLVVYVPGSVRLFDEGFYLRRP